MKQGQWRKKKQTKDEAKAAKRGKLDPDSELNRSAKEVQEERARNKRKLREMEAEDESESGSEQDDGSELEGIEREKPGEGLRKKVKLDEKEGEEEEEEEAPRKEKVVEEKGAADGEAVLSKKQKAKEEKKLAKQQKKEAKKGAKAETKAAAAAAVADEEDSDNNAEEPTAQDEAAEEAPVKSTEADSDDEELAPIDVSGLGDEDESASGSSQESRPDSPIFDTAKNASVEPASTTTSISSAVPPSEKPKYLKIPADTTALRARLEAKLAALRASRKADDADGTPIRTRQDLIESRRQKQAQRKAHKQELRKRAKEEEDRKREEALNSARNSPGLSPLFDQDDDRSANNFAFGRLAFSDGTQLSHDLSYEKSAAAGAKKRGASDPKTALLKLEAQKKRIAGMDEDKRKEVLEKETWLAARKRAEGEKVHDNESLLKKALKRKEKSKKKSEREWKERAESVQTSIHERQRKREENLRKRRDEKASHKGGKKKNKGVVTKKKNRPGFEGGFGGGRK